MDTLPASHTAGRRLVLVAGVARGHKVHGPEVLEPSLAQLGAVLDPLGLGPVGMMGV